jgi:hypothetical protein
MKSANVQIDQHRSGTLAYYLVAMDDGRDYAFLEVNDETLKVISSSRDMQNRDMSWFKDAKNNIRTLVFWFDIRPGKKRKRDPTREKNVAKGIKPPNGDEDNTISKR